MTQADWQELGERMDNLATGAQITEWSATVAHGSLALMGGVGSAAWWAAGRGLTWASEQGYFGNGTGSRVAHLSGALMQARGLGLGSARALGALAAWSPKIARRTVAGLGIYGGYQLWNNAPEMDGWQWAETIGSLAVGLPGAGREMRIGAMQYRALQHRFPTAKSGTLRSSWTRLKTQVKRDFRHEAQPFVKFGVHQVVGRVAPASVYEATQAFARRQGFKVCFAAGTPLLTPEGSKPIEEFRPGDQLLSRDEHTPDGLLAVQTVEEVFERVGQILHVHVGGQVIRTTAEHPFWVEVKGWTAAAELSAGDRLLGHDGQRVAVEEVYDTEEYERVYNLRVSEYHTYFVGSTEWGFSVWAHNAGCTPEEAAARIRQLKESLEDGISSPQLAKAVAQELKYLDTFVSGKFVEVQHITPGRGSKPAVTRTVYKNTEHFDGGVPAFVDQTTGAVHPVVKAKLAQGYTNKQLMQEGYAPIGRDGKPINLHHLEGREPGPMIELMQSVHQEHAVRLHDMIESGAGVQAIKSVQRRYERWAEKWWQQRANDF